MDGRLDHLDLVSGGTSPRAPKKPRAAPPPDRDHEQFTREALANIRDLIGAYQTAKRLFPDYGLDLLFRLRVYRYHEHTVTESLKRANCEPVVTRFEDDHDWIVRANDTEMVDLQEDIRSRPDRKTPSYIDSIKLVSGIDPTTKYGSLLRQNPLEETEKAHLVVSLWRGPGDDGEDRRARALDYLKTVVRKDGFEVVEELTMKNTCEVLVTTNRTLLEQISQIDYVSQIDRPPEFQLAQAIENYDYGGKPVPGSPPPGANAVAIVDTGVIRHPLLDNVIKDSLDMVPIRDDSRFHGTMVAGIAAYGNLEKPVGLSGFNPEVWIYSVQVMQMNLTGGGESRLPGLRLRNSLSLLKKKFPECRVANLSIIENGSEITGNTQASLSTVIDEISTQYEDMIFVTATGNTEDVDPAVRLLHPSYLFSNPPGRGILAPGTSSHAITVGSVRNPSSPLTYLPSTTTRVGPGIGGAIKPELVHVGGDISDQTVVLNPSYRKGWFALCRGTSLSAPMVSNHAARLLNLFPGASRNLIVALLLSSASMPTELPPMGARGKTKISKRASFVYGYGKPNLDHASHSDPKRVVLKHEGKITAGNIEYFIISVPPEFASLYGKRTISVALVFDPPCDPQRSTYIGTTMEFHLYRNHALADVRKRHALDDEPVNEYENLASNNNGKTSNTFNEIKMLPSHTLRNKTNHQKGVHQSRGRLNINSQFPLVLAVECKAAWEHTRITAQAFSVVVTMAHEALPNLYGMMQALNPGRARAR